MSDRYLGIVELDGTLAATILTKNSSDAALNADSAPSVRIYGPSGLVASTTLSTFQDTGSITDVSAANPAVVTSTGHGLTNGTKVTVTGVTGTGNITNANTTTTVANVTADTFELVGVDTSGGSYSSGGTWNVSGAYDFSVNPTAAGGYAVATNYSVVVTYAISSTTYSDVYSFTVA